jgi:imidazolonepropionase-like amidohydrolase
MTRFFLAALHVVITHVTVIDAAGRSSKPDMSVEIRGDRIARIEPSSEAAIPSHARVIDGTRKFLIPGLWDMHVHTFFGDWVPGGREVTLPLLLAFGVTGARDMGSDLDPILEARREAAAGRILSPRLVVSGPMLDGPRSPFPASISVATADDARRAVAKLADAGVDFIKVQSYIGRDAYFAVARECAKRNLAFVGHVPDAIHASEAVAFGQTSFEHLIGVFEGSSTAEDAMVAGGKKGLGRFLETYDAKKEAALAAVLAKDVTYQCPTLFWERGQWLIEEAAIDPSRDPDLRYAPVSWRTKSWPKFKKGIVEELDTDPLAVREKFVLHELGVVKRLHEAGVPFLAGTDTPAGVGVLPGASLHRELERFVAAGFTPLEALQTATRNPAIFLGKLADFGTVTEGKVADLVLLDANPLDDIRNTRRIAAVVAGGRLYTRADLDRILANVEEYARRH